MMAFFGKVKEGISRGVETVGVKSGGSLGAAVLKSEIDRLERQKRTAVEQLGDTVYALFLGGAPDEEIVRKRCLAVVSLDGKRLEKEEKLRQIRLRSGGAPGGPASDAPEDREEATDEGGQYGADGDQEMEGIKKCGGESMVCPPCDPRHSETADPGRKAEAPAEASVALREEGLDRPRVEDLRPAGDASIDKDAGAINAAPSSGEERREQTQGEGNREVTACPTYGAENLTPIDTALGAGADSRTGQNPIPGERDRERRSRRWVWPALAAVILLIAGAGAYLFYPGDTPMNPKAIERELNRRLSAQGLGVTTVITRDRTALVTGSVRNSEEKDLALSIVKSHEYVEEVSDAIATTEDVRTLKDRLSFVIQSMLALKNAIAADYAVNKRFLKTSDAPVIGSTYGIFVPETYGAFSIEDDGTIKTTIRNIADEVDDKTLELKPSSDLTVWHWVSGIDQRYLPFRMGGEIREVTLGPSTPGPVRLAPPRPAPPRPAANKPKPILPPKPVVQVRSRPALPPSPRPAALPGSPVPVDSARLEGEINRSLRKAGITGVTAEIRDDMGAVLKGTTISTTEKQKAIDIAKGFHGVRDIKDIVFVIEQ